MIPATETVYDIGHAEWRSDNALRLGELLVLPRPNDQTLATAYLRFENEGSLESLFYEGVPSLLWFVQNFQASERSVLACGHENGKGGYDLDGLGWINEVHTMAAGKFRKAECGMAFFRGAKNTVMYGQLMAEWAFTVLKLDALFGTTPEPNKLAVNYARNVGFELHGPLPHYASWKGELCACWLSVITREEWRKKHDVRP